MSASPPPPIPIRRATSADCRAIARVHLDAWRETYPGILPQAVIDAVTVGEREEQWRRALDDGAFVAVAEVAGAVAGFARAGANREPERAAEHPGELQALYVLREHHGAGVGRALFESVRTWLSTHELTPFVVWVASANPARGFYERLGCEHLATTASEIRGAPVSVSAYGGT